MDGSPMIKRIIEAALLSASHPLSFDRLESLFVGDDGAPDRQTIHQILEEIDSECAMRSYELKEVSGGFRLQIKSELTPWVQRLWEEKPPRYSRATLETLALIAYRQPVTRGEIESVRGVSVSSQIMKGLQERGWIRVVGRRDVPGRPALYATTREFLDYFGLKSLDELPPLTELMNFDNLHPQLDLGDPDLPGRESEATDESAVEASTASGQEG